MKPVLKSAKIRLVIGACLLLVLLIVATLFATGPKQLAASALTIIATNTMTNHNVVAVTFSNTSDISTVFKMNGRSPSLIMLFGDGERWTNASLPSLRSGLYVLPPHGTFATQVEIPAGVIKAKFGLVTTPFSRKSQMMFNWQTAHQLDSLRDITKCLFTSDELKSVEVWSDVIPVESEIRGSNGQRQP